MRNALCLTLLVLLASPVLAPADKKDDELNEIQRDIAAMDERVRELQKTEAMQADKLEALHSLIQQAATASVRVSEDMAALKAALGTNLTNALNDQQNKITQSVGPLGARVDSLGTSIDQLNATIGAMNDRLGRIEKKVSDVNDQISTMKAPAPAPPAPMGAAVPEATVGTSNGIPAGITKSGLQEDATRDYTTKNDELALTELANYVKYFPSDSWSPTAGYLMGMVYQRGKDYESATQAFQSVIDNYPGNNQTQDALFQKAMALELWPGHKTEAIDAFKSFIAKYPVNDNIPTAKRELTKLQTSASQTKGKRPPKQ